MNGTFWGKGRGERSLVADCSHGLRAWSLTSALVVGMSGGNAKLNDGMALPISITEVVFSFLG